MSASILHAAQLAVALSVFYVWTVRYPQVVADFERFGFPTTFRLTVGATKLGLAVALVIGLWLPGVVFWAAMGMAAFMVGAQWAHARVTNPLHKRLPSAVLLALSLFVALVQEAAAR
jgi:hypothetical protein